MNTLYRVIDNYSRTVHINLSQIVRSYQFKFDGLEYDEFQRRFKHEPQITLIVEVRAVHNDRFILFNLGNDMKLANHWVNSISRGQLDEVFSTIPKDKITSFDDPDLITRKSIL